MRKSATRSHEEKYRHARRRYTGNLRTLECPCPRAWPCLIDNMLYAHPHPGNPERATSTRLALLIDKSPVCLPTVAGSAISQQQPGVADFLVVTDCCDPSTLHRSVIAVFAHLGRLPNSSRLFQLREQTDHAVRLKLMHSVAACIVAVAPRCVTHYNRLLLQCIATRHHKV
jgi:hypothetical protein